MLTNFPINAKAPAAAAILEGSGLVDGYLRYAVGTRNPLTLLRLWWELVRWRPQVLVYLAPARGTKAAKRDAAFFRLCGIGRLVGVPLTDDMQASRVEADGALEYEAARLARNLAELGDARLDDTASWELRLTAAERARAASVLEGMEDRPFVAMSIGTKCQANDWERDNWRQLLGRIAAEYPGHGLAITGAAVDREYSDAVARGWRAVGAAGPVVNFCGELTPRESAAVFSRAKVFMGHDSGPMHLAAAVGTTCVAVFFGPGQAEGVVPVWAAAPGGLSPGGVLGVRVGGVYGAGEEVHPVDHGRGGAGGGAGGAGVKSIIGELCVCRKGSVNCRGKCRQFDRACSWRHVPDVLDAVPRQQPTELCASARSASCFARGRYRSCISIKR